MKRIAAAPQLTAVQRSRLTSLTRLVPGLPAPPGDVDEFLSRLSSAAAAEYIAHISRQPPITTVGALRELRLALLSEHVFDGALPGVAFTADLFSLTATEARSLLRRSVARQPDRLAPAMQADALSAVEAAEPVGKGRSPKAFVLSVDRTVMELLAEIVAQSPDHPPRITARPDAAGKYDLHAATRTALLKALGP